MVDGRNATVNRSAQMQRRRATATLVHVLSNHMSQATRWSISQTNNLSRKAVEIIKSDGALMN